MRNPSSSSGPGSPSSLASPAVGSPMTMKQRQKGAPTPCCTKVGLKRGPWTPDEDEVLAKFVRKEGEGRWRTLPKRAGLLRCGKSCRLRWMNYLRPSIKRGPIAPDEEDLILRLHRLLGNRWSLIAGRIPGRTDYEIKNYWNTHLRNKLISQGIDGAAVDASIFSAVTSSLATPQIHGRKALGVLPSIILFQAQPAEEIIFVVVNAAGAFLIAARLLENRRYGGARVCTRVRVAEWHSCRLLDLGTLREEGIRSGRGGRGDQGLVSQCLG